MRFLVEKVMGPSVSGSEGDEAEDAGEEQGTDWMARAWRRVEAVEASGVMVRV